MQLEHSFTVPVESDQAWKVLLDVERIAPCMPGATLSSVDGDSFTGEVKVKLGPINLTYKGKASFVEKDAAARRVVIEASGKETRGAGTAKASVSAALSDAVGGGTTVSVYTDLTITGRPAQFGRGMLQDVGGRLIDQFASCLAETLQAEPTAAAAASPHEAEDTIDLLEVSGVSAFASRYRVQIVGGLIGVLLVFWIIRRLIRR
jgi:carbon monoxide dehydrogenase subunit G